MPIWSRRFASRILRRAPLPGRVRSLLRRLASWSPSRQLAGNAPGLHGASPDDPDYAAWLRLNAFGDEAARLARGRLSSLAGRPLISVVVPVHDPEMSHLQMALGSVEHQLYPEWELCIADDASTNPAVPAFLRGYTARQPRARWVRLEHQQHIAGATNAAIALARGDFLAFLDHDDELTPDALLEVACLLEHDPTADIIYSDHDILGQDGLRRSPRFKPDWCPELLLSYMYFGHLKVYRTEHIRELGGLRAGFEGSADYDLALRVVERTDRIRHIPKILYHWRAAPRSMARASDTKPNSFEAGRRALAEAIERRAITGTVEQPPWAKRAGIGAYRIRFRETSDVPVTIIIPTRDKVTLLSDCIDSIERKTVHRKYEILIIDNESREAGTLEYLRRSPHHVIPFHSRGQFNFAAMVNRGVAEAQTEYFVLLNNDTVVVAPEWLDEMVGYARFPGMGAVGAKLIYPDGRIQHAGVILGTHGLTGHAFQPRLDTLAPLEYECYAHVGRNYLAVTAACMLSNKTVFTEIGGFNDRDLKVAWNDVDYCLRLRQSGYRVVVNPYAVLHHMESQSRGDDKDPEEIRYMMANWGSYIDHDPFYSPNFSRLDAEFRIKTDPDEERSFYYRQYRHSQQLERPQSWIPPAPSGRTKAQPIIKRHLRRVVMRWRRVVTGRPAGLLAAVDHPSLGQVIKVEGGVLSIRGWAWSRSGHPETVSLEIDDGVRTRHYDVTHRFCRVDVAHSIPEIPLANYVGFEISLDRYELPATATLSIVVRSPEGELRFGDAALEVVGGPPRPVLELADVACDCCGGTRLEEIGKKSGLTIKRCTNCGLAFTSPRPPLDIVQQRSPAGFSHDEYSRAMHQRLGERRQYWQHLLSYVERFKGLSRQLLEIGCGGGYLLREARALGWDACGVDINAAAVAHARSLGLEVELNDIATASLGERRFGAVVLDRVIENLISPQTAIGKCCAALQPGGGLLIVTIGWEGDLFMTRGMDFADVGPAEHLYYFSTASLCRMCESAGLRVESCWRDATGDTLMLVATRRLDV